MYKQLFCYTTKVTKKCVTNTAQITVTQMCLEYNGNGLLFFECITLIVQPKKVQEIDRKAGNARNVLTKRRDE